MAKGEKSLAWTRKYRPNTLEDYVGNEGLKQKTRVLLDKGKLPNTILLMGSRGTGKTTFARLLAKSLHCKSKVNGMACGECESCQQLDEKYIMEGIAPRNMEIYEYDITKMNKREDAQTIVAKMSQRSFSNEVRVFILDEVQRATSEAQSSFLKITEEPVENLYIIMCTTDPEDLLVPLKSRFHHFKVKRPSTPDLMTRLAHICREEGVDYTREGLRLLIDRCGAIPREVINRAELIGLTSEISRKAVEKEMHVISRDLYMGFLENCEEGNLSTLILGINKLQREQDFTFAEFVEGLGEFFYELLSLRSGVKLDMYSTDDAKELRKFIKSYPDKNIIEILKTIKEYTNVSSKGGATQDFLFLSLAIQIMEILNVKDEVKEVPVEKAGKTYSEVTRKIKEDAVKNRTKVGTKATEATIMNIFDDVAKVDIKKN